ncbi:MAG: toxin-antitoxin system HicB family antitoxin [Oscillospiraceae bacterium]|nr:toxin-antitoxin system HicB family antitoxin [Oscillospiraceae bacterium]
MTVKKNAEIYTLEEYMAMPYKVIITSTGETGDNAFFAEILELDGCCVDGATPNEVYDALVEEMAIHIQLYLKNDIPPPIPKSVKRSNAKVLVRMPSTLQQELAARAQLEEISINQLIVNKLSSA